MADSRAAEAVQGQTLLAARVVVSRRARITGRTIAAGQIEPRNFSRSNLPMAPTVNRQLESHIQAFVTEISSLVRVAALEAVRDALGGGASPARRGPGRPRGTGRRGPGRTSKAMAARPARGGKRVKRTTADVDATARNLLAYVKANDGKRMDEIATAMGTTVKDLVLPAQRLLATKAVKTSGQRRGTKYHVGGGSMPKSAAPAVIAPAKSGKRAQKA